LQLFCHGKDKILRPAGWRNHAIGKSFFQFSFGCTRLLRAREVFFQSGRAADRYGATDPDQFAGSGIKYLFILEIKNFLADFHGSPFCNENGCCFRAIYYIPPANGIS